MQSSRKLVSSRAPTLGPLAMTIDNHNRSIEEGRHRAAYFANSAYHGLLNRSRPQFSVFKVPDESVLPRHRRRRRRHHSVDPLFPFSSVSTSSDHGDAHTACSLGD